MDSTLIWLIPSGATCLALLVRYPVGVGMLLVMMVLPSSLKPSQIFGITGFNAINGPFLVMLACTLLRTPRAARYDRKLVVAFWIVMSLLTLAVVRSALDFGALAPWSSAAFPSAATPFSYVRGFLLKPVQYVITVWIAARCFQNENAQRVLLYYVMIGFSLGCLAVLLSPAMLDRFLSGTLPNLKHDIAIQNAFGSYPNTAQLHICLILFLALCFRTWGTASRERVAAVSCILILGVSLLTCHSRASLASFACATVVFMGIQRPGSVRVVSGFVLVAMLGLSLLFVPAFRQKAKQALAHGPWTALSVERVGIWKPLLEDLTSHALVGRGRHGMMRSPKYDRINRKEGARAIDHPHNAYLEAHLDAGILGLGAVLYLVWLAVRQMWGRVKLGPHQASISAAAGLCAVGAFCASAFAGQTFYPGGDNLILMIFLFLGTIRQTRLPVRIRQAAPGSGARGACVAGRPPAHGVSGDEYEARR